MINVELYWLLVERDLKKFEILISNSIQASRNAIVPQFSISADGKIVMGGGRSYHMTLFETSNTAEAKDRIISLSSNLTEAGNIKTREGLGAYRAEPLLQKSQKRSTLKLEESDTTGSDFMSRDGSGVVTMRYSLKAHLCLKT